MSIKKTIGGSGNLWTLGIGLGLLIWGALSLIDGLVWNRGFAGTYWLLIPGAIMLFSGISTIIAYRYNREKILSALTSYERISVEQLANELGMQEKDVKETIIDLRTEGQLRASFEPESGDVMVLAVRGQAPISAPQTSTSMKPEEPSEKKPAASPEGFCPYCGSMVKPGDRFCNNCGSAL